jgi:hypothetical protein
MKPLNTFEKWYGRDEPPPAVAKLKAGEFTVEFQDGDLRYIRYGDHELIRRIYVAIRDVNWNTIQAKMTGLRIDSGEDRFKVQFDAAHQDGALVFRWQANIEGKPDGTIEYTMKGVAENDFRYCRIGFCVLHPIEGISGSPYWATTPTGQVSGVLPTLIEPQWIENGFETAIFPAFSGLKIQMPAGINLTAEFEGDLFEMEDQRNWTDGSFKTYCTPIALGYPHKAKAGQEFYQKVIVRAEVPAEIRGIKPVTDSQAIRLTLAESTSQQLPKLGFCIGDQGTGLDKRELALLSRLHPDHLKAELHFQDSSWLRNLDKALSTANRLSSPLELAIFLTDDPEEALEKLRVRLSGMPIARVIVFHEADAPIGTTSASWMQLVHEYLAGTLPETTLVGGTNGNFAEVNRQRPDISVMGGVAYTINPQVHAWDERSLIEALEGQRDTVVTARSYCGRLPICISAVTLKPPFNQAATEEEAPQDPDEMPASVDQRQMSLFAAAWTVGSIHSLAVGCADSITFYETHGWRGLQESRQGNPLPHRFRSSPGMIYPVYYVFDFLAKAKGARILQTSLDRPLLLCGLAFEKDNRLGLLVSNLQPASQEVQMLSMPEGDARLRRLNEDTMEIAAFDPDAFWEQSESLHIHHGETVWSLKPYETVFMEMEITQS